MRRPDGENDAPGHVAGDRNSPSLASDENRPMNQTPTGFDAAESSSTRVVVAQSPLQDSRQESRSSTGDRDWSARIRESIDRLLEIDGISLAPSVDTDGNDEVERTVPEQQSFQQRVDRVVAASEVAHTVYWDTLRDVYSTTAVKRRRVTPPPATPTTTTRTTPSSTQPRHEALDTLVRAAATEQTSEDAILATQAKTLDGVREDSLSSKASSGRRPIAVHDPVLVKAVENLGEKMTQLLNQLQLTSDEDAAEPILAAAAAIALEATEMRRCKQIAMTRLLEIEQHRQQIMQGMLEYSQREEKRQLEAHEESKADCTGGNTTEACQDSTSASTSAQADDDNES